MPVVEDGDEKLRAVVAREDVGADGHAANLVRSVIAFSFIAATAAT
jgi:hypothetical protein